VETKERRTFALLGLLRYVCVAGGCTTFRESQLCSHVCQTCIKDVCHSHPDKRNQYQEYVQMWSSSKPGHSVFSAKFGGAEGIYYTKHLGM
jgi:hypothetical protein